MTIKQSHPKLITFDYKRLAKYPTQKSNGVRPGKPRNVIIHNTANSAPASNEAAYVANGNARVSYHYAVDHQEVWQVLPDEYTSWNSGSVAGNTWGIAIEICYSLIPGDNRYPQAETNGAKLAAALLMRHGLTIAALKKHQDYNGKYCPHRILDGIGWPAFVQKVKSYMLDPVAHPGTPDQGKVYKVMAGPLGSVESANKLATQLIAEGHNTHRTSFAGQIYVQTGAYTNYESAVKELDKLAKRGYSSLVTLNPSQPAVSDTKLKESDSPPAPVLKALNVVAREVIAGHWGNGDERKQLLTSAGYDYLTVQQRVNQLL